ncbi:hypothetical protein B4589_002110 [Halolamina sp. CBA1230]|uniref:hypothetical protein n=1 Tax=Halolamina sp. CBA1230 TaxID=1853690 RepID=UPI0009A1DE0A|nr:hypothetical protein [Halolamina sp. CBA1230]QKY19226.1 hypothetical protein B4589_002110 [Halolamina sp. CBA1230]
MKNDIQTSLQLLVGAVLGVVGVAVLFRAGAGVGSLSTLGVGLGFLYGLVTGVADHIEPLRRAFERGQWLIVGVAVLVLFVIVLNDAVTPALLGSLALGLGGGVLLGTAGVVGSTLSR